MLPTDRTRRHRAIDVAWSYIPRGPTDLTAMRTDHSDILNRVVPLAVIGLPCRSVPGRGGPQRRRRQRPDGLEPSVRAGSVSQRSSTGMSGNQRSPTVRRNPRSRALRLTQLGQHRREVQIVVPKGGGSSPLDHPTSGSTTASQAYVTGVQWAGSPSRSRVALCHQVSCGCTRSSAGRRWR
jgi:hypothetical protein